MVGFGVWGGVEFGVVLVYFGVEIVVCLYVV